MNREEAKKLLRGGPEGIEEWNRRRKEGEEIPSLEGIDLHSTNLKGVNFHKAQLNGANFSGAKLIEANLIEANLIGANLSYADLREADLREANSRHANFTEASLIGANLSNADLREANLSYVGLREAILAGADLRQAYLSMESFLDVNLRGVKLDESQIQSLSSYNTAVGRILGMDVEAELKIEKDRVSELQVQLKNLGDNVPPGEHEKVKKELEKALEESQANAKKLEEENNSIKAERDTTQGRIKDAIKCLEAPNRYIFWEKGIHNFMFLAFLILTILCFVYLCYSFNILPIGKSTEQENNKTHVDNNKTDQMTGFEMIILFAPRVFVASLLGVFLTQANRRRRSVQELQERKRAIETLRGVFLAINTLSDTPLLARQRIDKILDKLAEQALELGKAGPYRPTKADHESDRVELLKEFEQYKIFMANRKP